MTAQNFRLHDTRGGLHNVPMTRFMIGELDVTDPDLAPRVLVERRAAGDDEVGPEAIDAELLARLLLIIAHARLRQDHERVRVVVRNLKCVRQVSDQYVYSDMHTDTQRD